MTGDRSIQPVVGQFVLAVDGATISQRLQERTVLLHEIWQRG